MFLCLDLDFGTNLSLIKVDVLPVSNNAFKVLTSFCFLFLTLSCIKTIGLRSNLGFLCIGLPERRLLREKFSLFNSVVTKTSSASWHTFHTEDSDASSSLGLASSSDSNIHLSQIVDLGHHHQ